MSRSRTVLSRATLALTLSVGTSALALALATSDPALASCELATPTAGSTGNNPPSGATVTCSGGLDNDGVENATANDVTVNIEAPSGGISTTGDAGVLLGDNATINVNSAGGSRLPINTSGDNARGIDVQNGATINVDGQVTTAGENSTAISTLDNANVTVGTNGLVRTGGGTSPAIQVGANSTVTVRGGGGDVGGTVVTGNSMSDAVVLDGAGSTLTVENGASVTTSAGMSNPVEVRAANGTVNVAGDVRSSSGNATAILGTTAASGLTVNVMSGGFVTAQSSGSNAIESQGTGARINVMQGGEVRISSGSSAAIMSGDQAQVTVGGTVTASSSQSQGVVLGDASTLTVTDSGVIRTSSSESQAVRIGTGATTANVTVRRGGNIDAVGAQAILDPNMGTATTVDVSGRVFGGSSESVIDLGGGADTVTVNEGGTITGTGGDPVVSLGTGDDRLSVRSTNGITVQGNMGTLGDGGAGVDTLDLQTGGTVDASRFVNFETTNVGANPTTGAGTTANNAAANGTGSTVNVNQGGTANNASAINGGTVNVNQGGTANNATASGAGSSVNVASGGTASVGPNSATNGGQFNFASGSTANTNAGGQTRETQNFGPGVNFAPGTNVGVSNSDIITGTASGNQIDLAVGPNAFTNAAALRSAGIANTAAVAAALDLGLVADPAALDAAIASRDLSLLTTGNETAALLSRLSGEIAAQAGAGGIQAALGFNDALQPGGLGGIAVPTTAVAPVAYAAPVPATEQAYFADVIAPPAVSVTPRAETGVWMAGLAGAFDVDAGLGAPYDGDVLGLAAGVERQASFGPFRDYTVGLAIGYTNTDVQNPFDVAEVDAFHVGAYASGQIGIVQTASALSYAYLDIELPGAADADGHVFTSRTDAAIDAFAFNGVTLGPVARIESLFASIDDVAPLGPLGTTLSDGDVSQFVAGIGLRAGFGFGTGTVRVDAVYEHAFGDDALVFDADVIGQPFAVGASLGDDERFRFGAGYDVRVGSAEVGLRYDGTFADDAEAHAGSVRATLRF